MTINRAFLILLAVLLLPSLALAQTNTRATFNVSKDFNDDNTAAVTVEIDCNSGQILDQDKVITEGTDVQFVLTEFTDGLPTNCTITEVAVEGYSTTYDNCEILDVADGGDYDCFVTNDPDPVDVTITKEWVIENDGGDVIDSEYELDLWCYDEIIGGKTYNQGDTWHYNFQGSGTGTEEYSAGVIPNWDGGTDCWVEETVYDSSVESDSSDCDDLHVTVGGVGYLDEDDELVADIDECTVTNTVFYEGIPTLSQYGMAILALLMLGMGFVGFRRFV